MDYNSRFVRLSIDQVHKQFRIIYKRKYYIVNSIHYNAVTTDYAEQGTYILHVMQYFVRKENDQFVEYSYFPMKKRVLKIFFDEHVKMFNPQWPIYPEP